MPVQLEDLAGLCTWYAPASLWTSDRPGRRRRAQQICRTCDLMELCQTWTLHHLVLEPDNRIVSGGLTEKQIRKVRKQQGITPPRARMPSTAKPKLLGVGSMDDAVRRQMLTKSHSPRSHPEPVPGCAHCAAQ